MLRNEDYRSGGFAGLKVAMCERRIAQCVAMLDRDADGAGEDFFNQGVVGVDEPLALGNK